MSTKITIVINEQEEMALKEKDCGSNLNAFDASVLQTFISKVCSKLNTRDKLMSANDLKGTQRLSFKL